MILDENHYVFKSNLPYYWQKSQVCSHVHTESTIKISNLTQSKPTTAKTNNYIKDNVWWFQKKLVF